jgi:hypothetical protein
MEGVLDMILSKLKNEKTLTLPIATRLGPSLSREAGEGLL